MSTGTDRRTIGAILRSHGYVSDFQLQEAADVQARTGKPLGQVLVEAGVITRLELASALAEQWSESSDWMHSPGSDHLSDASVASAGIGLTAERHEPDAGVLAARLSNVESSLQELLRSEPATAPLEHAVADLARRLTMLEPTLAELERRTASAVDAEALESHLTELAAAVGEAAKRATAASEGITQLGSAITALQDRSAQLDEVPRTEEIAELRAQVAELLGRPAGDPESTVRIDRLAEEVSALRADSRVPRLEATVAELAVRPSESAALAERLDELARRVDALVVEAGSRAGGEVPDELRLAIEELASRPPVDAALSARVDEIARRMSELPSVSDVRRLDQNVAAVSSQLDKQIDDLSTRLGGLASPVDLAALQDAVDALSHRPEGDPSLSDRLSGLAERVDALGGPDHLRALDDRVDALSSQLDAVAQSLASHSAGPQPAQAEAVAALDSKIADLDLRLSALADSAGSVGGDEALPTDVAARLESAEHASQGLSAELSRTAEIWYAGRAELEARLERLEGRIAARSASVAADGSPQPQPHVIEQEVERVLMAVERLGLHLSEHDRALAELMSRRGPSKVEELAARIDELETYGIASGAAAAATPGDNSGAAPPVSLADTRDLRAELRSLTRQVSELEDTSKTDREKFLTQLERMASSIDWRIRRIESGENTP